MSNMWQTFNQTFFLCVLTPAKASTRNVNISQSRTKPALTARGHLTAPANHSTTQAKEETPLKIKTIKHLGWRVQMIWDLKERKKKKIQFCRNSNRRMACSHPWLPTEDIYWDTEKDGSSKGIVWLCFSQKKEDRSSFSPRVSRLCWGGMAHHTHRVHGHCQEACISRPRSVDA